MINPVRGRDERSRGGAGVGPLTPTYSRVEAGSLVERGATVTAATSVVTRVREKLGLRFPPLHPFPRGSVLRYHVRPASWEISPYASDGRRNRGAAPGAYYDVLGGAGDPRPPRPSTAPCRVDPSSAPAGSPSVTPGSAGSRDRRDEWARGRGVRAAAADPGPRTMAAPDSRISRSLRRSLRGRGWVKALGGGGGDDDDRFTALPTASRPRL